MRAAAEAAKRSKRRRKKTANPAKPKFPQIYVPAAGFGAKSKSPKSVAVDTKLTQSDASEQPAAIVSPVAQSSQNRSAAAALEIPAAFSRAGAIDVEMKAGASSMVLTSSSRSPPPLVCSSASRSISPNKEGAVHCRSVHCSRCMIRSVFVMFLFFLSFH